MTYQFIHIESYGRAAGKDKTNGNSVQSIVNEAIRNPGDCNHVEQPMPPTVHYGHHPSQLMALCQGYAATMMSSFTRKNRKTGIEEQVTRKMRQDGLVMIGGVFSVPEDFPDVDWPEYRAQIIAELLNEFGNRLKSVIEHTDEAMRHCHFYVIPEPGERFDDIHVGRKAASVAKTDGKLKYVQNNEYKNAMRKWQDRYFQISVNFGLARLGPKVTRKTMAEAKAEAVQRAHDANLKRKALEAIQQAALRAKNIKAMWNKLANDQQLMAKTKRKNEVEQERLRSLSGKGGELLAGFLSGFTVATLAIREWFINYGLWPGSTMLSEAKFELKAKELKLKLDREAIERERQNVERTKSKNAQEYHHLLKLKAKLEMVDQLKHRNDELERDNAALSTENNMLLDQHHQQKTNRFSDNKN